MLANLKLLFLGAIAVSAAALPATDIQPCTQLTEKVGDGNPHPRHKQIQVTDNLNCGSGGSGCSVTKLYSHTVDWGFTFGSGSGGETEGPLQWISGGFGVSKSFTTGESFSCDAKPGQTVCVWDSIHYTAYTVRQVPNGNCLSSSKNTYIMSSPVSSGGNSYYCVYGSACRSNGQNYWVDK